MCPKLPPLSELDTMMFIFAMLLVLLTAFIFSKKLSCNPPKNDPKIIQLYILEHSYGITNEILPEDESKTEDTTDSENIN